MKIEILVDGQGDSSRVARDVLHHFQDLLKARLGTNDPAPTDVCHFGAACSKAPHDELHHVRLELESARKDAAHLLQRYNDMKEERDLMQGEIDDQKELARTAALREKKYWAMIFEDVINEQMRGLPRKKNGSP